MREDLFLARWHHARAAALPDKILKEAVLLLDLYQRQGRAAAFLDIFDTVLISQRELPDTVRIGVGWAYLTEGKCDDAISWLDLMRPDDLATAADAAGWGLARAEAEKSCGRPGSKRNARLYLEAALAAIEKESSEDHRRLRLRCLHDLARLTHFFERNPGGAVQQYEEVARQWKALPLSDLDRAITLRNLAEALMNSGRAIEAEQHVVEARRLIPAWTRHPVVSELEYFAGRLAIKLRLGETEISRRFEDCRAKALTTSHLMMAAIVESRIFWRSDPGQAECGLFDDVAWAAAARRLALFERHAWAARVAIDGHLRAARRLAERGERFPSRRELAEARRIVEANPDLEEGSDRRRIAVLYAGLEIYEPSAQHAWEVFQQRYGWACEWIAAQPINSPEKAWELAG